MELTGPQIKELCNVCNICSGDGYSRIPSIGDEPCAYCAGSGFVPKTLQKECDELKKKCEDRLPFHIHSSCEEEYQNQIQNLKKELLEATSYFQNIGEPSLDYEEKDPKVLHKKIMDWMGHCYSSDLTGMWWKGQAKVWKSLAKKFYNFKNVKLIDLKKQSFVLQIQQLAIETIVSNWDEDGAVATFSSDWIWALDFTKRVQQEFPNLALPCVNASSGGYIHLSWYVNETTVAVERRGNELFCSKIYDNGTYEDVPCDEERIYDQIKKYLGEQ